MSSEDSWICMFLYALTCQCFSRQLNSESIWLIVFIQFDINLEINAELFWLIYYRNHKKWSHIVLFTGTQLWHSPYSTEKTLISSNHWALYFAKYLWGDLCVWWSVRAMQETYFTEFLPHLSENRAFITTLASVKFLSQNNALCWCDTLITNLVLLHWQRIKKNQIHSSYITSTSEQDMFERQFKNHIIIP